METREQWDNVFHMLWKKLSNKNSVSSKGIFEKRKRNVPKKQKLSEFTASIPALKTC